MADLFFFYSAYEVEAGKDLCEMVGFDKELGRGHLTAGGTVANCEAMWCARNVKFLPFAMQDAVKEVPELVEAQGMSIDLPGGGTKKLVEATTWDLLNLNTDVIVEMPDKVSLADSFMSKGPLSFIVQIGKGMKIEEGVLFDPQPLPTIPRIYRYDKAFEVKFLTLTESTIS